MSHRHRLPVWAIQLCPGMSELHHLPGKPRLGCRGRCRELPVGQRGRVHRNGPRQLCPACLVRVARDSSRSLCLRNRCILVQRSVSTDLATERRHLPLRWPDLNLSSTPATVPVPGRRVTRQHAGTCARARFVRPAAKGVGGALLPRGAGECRSSRRPLQSGRPLGGLFLLGSYLGRTQRLGRCPR